MNLDLDPTTATGYTSNTQIARLVTEAWAAENLYCLACASENLARELPNSPVRDFTCSSCLATYQLKSKNGKHGSIVSNSAYSKKIAAIDRGEVPHYAFLDYSRARWKVTGLFVVPGHLIGRSVIEKRKPLGPQARRAGWVGSNILLGEIPTEGRIQLISADEVVDPSAVRESWKKVAFLATDARASQGWGADILVCVRILETEKQSPNFTLREFYGRFAERLSQLHPENFHVKPKIRQQLQVLRDGNVLAFLGKGRYQIIG